MYWKELNSFSILDKFGMKGRHGNLVFWSVHAYCFSTIGQTHSCLQVRAYVLAKNLHKWAVAKRSCLCGGDKGMLMRQLTRCLCGLTQTRVLLTRGPYCHSLTKNELLGFERGSNELFRRPNWLCLYKPAFFGPWARFEDMSSMIARISG